MSRTAYGYTHEKPCILCGHCYHHMDRFGMLMCCVCQHILADFDNDDMENDCGD